MCDYHIESLSRPCGAKGTDHSSRQPRLYGEVRRHIGPSNINRPLITLGDSISGTNISSIQNY